MKAILMSIRPEWVAKILNGEKTIEVRKGTRLHKAIQNLIKEQGIAPTLIYCTKGKEQLFICKDHRGTTTTLSKKDKNTFSQLMANGKVVARFDATSEIIDFHQHKAFSNDGYEKEPTVVWEDYHTPSFACGLLEEPTCLTFEQMHDYLKGEQGTAVYIIKDTLKVFDEPKELKEFYKVGCEEYFTKHVFVDHPNFRPIYESELKQFELTKAPQSWCFVEI